MDDLTPKLEKLGDAVSDTADRITDPTELDAARGRWLRGLSPPPRRARGGARSRTFLLAAAACLGVLLAVFVLVAARRGDRVSFVVGTPPVRGDVGAWVAAEQDGVLLRFSEGTSFTVAPGARVRVTETTPHGATVLLERGDVAAAVTHLGHDTRWSVRAGPFEVHVTGTRFDASWDPTGEVFALVMQEGAVVVEGPLLRPGRELRAGERLRISVREGSLELRTASSSSSKGAQASSEEGAPAPSAARSEGAAAASVASPEGAPAPAPASARAAPAAQEASWRDLAAAGKYVEALAAAERAGFTQEVERVSSQDLVLLADAARYSARPALARQALLAQRRRFGVRGSSAFVLGKIAADQQGAAADAVRWFETYLSEEPNGALAEQALGRIVELRRGNAGSARAAAERYLARYPRGAHAALARSLISP